MNRRKDKTMNDAMRKNEFRDFVNNVWVLVLIAGLISGMAGYMLPLKYSIPFVIVTSAVLGRIAGLRARRKVDGKR